MKLASSWVSTLHFDVELNVVMFFLGGNLRERVLVLQDWVGLAFGFLY